MLITARQDRRDTQLNLRVATITKRALEFFARRIGDRKTARLAEDFILDGLETLVRQEGLALVEWRWPVEIEIAEAEEEAKVVWERVFLRYHPAQAQEEEKKSRKLAALFHHLRKEGIKPEKLEPGLYVYVMDELPEEEFMSVLSSPVF